MPACSTRQSEGQLNGASMAVVAASWARASLGSGGGDTRSALGRESQPRTRQDTEHATA